ncbi:MAG: carbohydrate porin, partial [Caulobacteraceae bacterium]|nr:carbohydrate porin [Caulobacteraceae bacterium]
MRVWQAAFAGGAIAFFASLAAAQELADPTAPGPPASGAPPREITFTGAYIADALADLEGGKRAGERYVDQLKVSAAFDGAAWGRGGLTAMVSVEHHNGASFSGELVGDVQVVSDVDLPPEAWRLYEAWVQQTLPDGRAGVKGGIIDLNNTFDVQGTAALFLNSSHGIGPDLSQTGLDGPSINPTPALGLTAFWRPAPEWTAQLGLFDGVAGDPQDLRRFVSIELSARGGALAIGQVERRWGKAVRLEVGAWAYTAAFDALDRFDAAGAPLRVRGNAGLYGLAEGRLLAKRGSQDGGLSGWVRIGWADDEINRIATYLGAGLVYTGLVPGRGADQSGLAIARAGFG